MRRCWIVALCLFATHGAWAAEKIPIGINGDHAPKDLGLNFTCVLYDWQENRPGVYRWTGLKDDPFMAQLKALKEAKFTIAVTLTHVHMDQKHLPPDLKAKRFNDPVLLKRWNTFLQEFLTRYGDLFDFLNVGNEVNNYFGAHPSEWKDYVEFFNASSTLVHKLKPKLKVGLVLGSGELNSFWKDIESSSDYLGVTYYTPNSSLVKAPTAPALNPSRPEYFGRRLDEVLKLSGKKPVLMTEVGCATHAAIDSSPELQAEFIRKFFAWLRGKEAKVLAMSWLSLRDRPYEGTKTALKGYLDEKLLQHEPFMRYLTSLGLMYEDGREKPGYKAFKEELAKYRGS
jgi:hypothetical protein